MASTYSTNLALELIGTGDQAGTWGNTTNTNLGTLIEQAISGYVTQAVSTGATTTITIPNGATGVARNMFIELTGTGGTNTVLEVPANKKLYFIYNNASGAVTVKVTGQTGVSVAAGQKVILVSNGTDVVEATTYITAVPSSITVTTLNATSASITTATGTTFSATNMGTQATTQFQGASANITTVTGTTISATNMGAQATTQFQAASANITTVTGTTAGFTSANITTATGTTFSATTMGGQSTTTFLGTSANITTITGTTATFTTSSDGAGNLRNIPSAGTSKTSEYTLTTSDLGEFVTISTSGKVLVPNNTFATGNVISVYNDTTGNVSINISTTTGYVVGTNTNRTGVTLATRGIATILFINPSYCILSGNLT